MHFKLSFKNVFKTPVLKFIKVNRSYIESAAQIRTDWDAHTEQKFKKDTVNPIKSDFKVVEDQLSVITLICLSLIICP